MGPRIRRTRRGEIAVDLSPDERALLRSLAPQLAALLAHDDAARVPWLARLFPTAYPDDPEREAEYRRMTGDELTARHVHALRTLEETADADRLDAEQAAAWMGALNELRLVLGTRLDVSEETTDENFEPGSEEHGLFLVYVFLGWLQEQLVDALAAG